MCRRSFLLAIVTIAAIGCTGKGTPDRGASPRIATVAGTQFPASSVLLGEEGSFSGSHAIWMIRADEAFNLPGERKPVLPGPVRLEMEKLIQVEQIGELADPMATEFTWENPGGRWRASTIRSDRGFFLQLERFTRS